MKSGLGYIRAKKFIFTFNFCVDFGLKYFNIFTSTCLQKHILLILNSQNQQSSCSLLPITSNFLVNSCQQFSVLFSSLPFLFFFLLFCWFCKSFLISSHLCPHLPLLLVVLQASLLLLHMVTFLCVCLQFCFSCPHHLPKISFIPQTFKFSSQAPRP